MSRDGNSDYIQLSTWLQASGWSVGARQSLLPLQGRFFACRLPAYKDLKTDIFPTDTIFLYMSSSLKNPIFQHESRKGLLRFL